MPNRSQIAHNKGRTVFDNRPVSPHAVHQLLEPRDLLLGLTKMLLELLGDLWIALIAVKLPLQKLGCLLLQCMCVPKPSRIGLEGGVRCKGPSGRRRGCHDSSPFITAAASTDRSINRSRSELGLP